MSAPKPRLVCFARDQYPLNRADVAILFGLHLSADLDVTWCVKGTAEDQGAHAEKVGVVRVAGSVLAQIGMHCRASFEILAGRYDAVQCRDLIIISAWYALISRLAGKPFVYWMSFPIDIGYRNLAQRYGRFSPSRLARATLANIGSFLLNRWTLPSASMIFAQSNLMVEKLAGRGLDTDRLVAVPMGFEPTLFCAEGSSARLGSIAEGTRVVLYVGTLDTERNLAVAFEGVASVLARLPDVVFVVAGPATDAQRAEILEILSRQHADERVHFLGSVPLQELPAVIRRATVCLSAVPNTEMFDVSTPTKLVEYVACGRRAVVNHLPDHDLVASMTGYCEVVEFTPEAFQAGVERALSLGPIPTGTLENARSWLVENRAYPALAERCRIAYGRLFS